MGPDRKTVGDLAAVACALGIVACPVSLVASMWQYPLLGLFTSPILSWQAVISTPRPPSR